MPSYFFLHPASHRSWPTDDPHQWLLDHRDDELLAAVRERLVLSYEDPERCLRAATRRCGLALIRVVNESQIIVQHWSNSLSDVRAWAKEHGWAKPGVRVSFENVKNGKVVVHDDGRDVLMHGERIGETFPWSEYEAKYEQRMIEEADDQNAAPAAFTNFGWEGVPRGRLTWTVLKSVWRSESVPCPNCNVLLALTSFGWHQGPLSRRSARLFRHCVMGCRRRFEHHDLEALAWVASVLPPALRPDHLEQWQRFEISWDRLDFRHHRPVQFVNGEE